MCQEEKKKTGPGCKTPPCSFFWCLIALTRLHLLPQVHKHSGGKSAYTPVVRSIKSSFKLHMAILNFANWKLAKKVKDFRGLLEVCSQDAAARSLSEQRTKSLRPRSASASSLARSLDAVWALHSMFSSRLDRCCRACMCVCVWMFVCLHVLLSGVLSSWLCVSLWAFQRERVYPIWGKIKRQDISRCRISSMPKFGTMQKRITWLFTVVLHGWVCTHPLQV